MSAVSNNRDLGKNLKSFHPTFYYLWLILRNWILRDLFPLSQSIQCFPHPCRHPVSLPNKSSSPLLLVWQAPCFLSSSLGWFSASTAFIHHLMYIQALPSPNFLLQLFCRVIILHMHLKDRIPSRGTWTSSRSGLWESRKF